MVFPSKYNKSDLNYYKGKYSGNEHNSDKIKKSYLLDSPRIALLGCGGWGKNLMRIFHNLGALKLVCDPVKSATDFAEKNAPRVGLTDNFNDVIKSNKNRSFALLNRISKFLKNKFKNKKICFLGVTFKANTDDMRESSSLLMIPFLLKKGAIINYYDPSGIKNEFSKYKNLLFCNDINKACSNVDLVIIHTEWEEFKALDFRKLNKKKKFKIYDMRNLYSAESMKKKGLSYYSIGR